MREHMCPVCNQMHEFSPVLSDRSKCFGCHAIVENSDLVALAHVEDIQAGDLTGEMKYG